MKRYQGATASFAADERSRRRDPGSRFRLLGSWLTAVLLLVAALLAANAASAANVRDADVDRAVTRGLDWLKAHQSRLGNWTANGGMYPTSITAMSGIAFLCEGSTTTQGKYAPVVRKTMDYLLSRSRANGLIGDPHQDDKYTYGHGFSMLFLSQLLGEEEDTARREELVKALTKAVKFTGYAQAPSGGWGYVSTQDQPGFDEGSTTITQVQGLRGCRNAGIPVPKEIIDKAIKYIQNCTDKNDGGVHYNSMQHGSHPPISAAAIACLFNAGDYDDKFVPKLLAYCHRELGDVSKNPWGHWHYAHYYYAQVLYREGGQSWKEYRNAISARIISEANQEGCWTQGMMGPAYTSAMNLTILQLQRGVLPIYQR